MPRKWLWCVVVIAAGTIVWNEYRLWTKREPAAALQVVQSSTHPDEAPVAEASQRTGSGEEESEVTVIDLTWLQRQTIEPPAAETEEPAALPPASSATERRPLSSDLKIPLQFREHSADGDDCCATPAKLTNVWKTLIGWIWAHDGAEESEPRNPMVEQLFVLPRPLAEPQHCPETSVCPYLNGTAGQHYRR
jgi:hypothetical protein